MSSTADIPSAKPTIEFKTTSDLLNDKRTSQNWYPSLARSRAQRIKSDDFDIINRDFCLLRSPGRVSWQSKDSYENVEMERFHTDTVKVPKHEIITRNLGVKTLWTGLAQWYLHDLTRAYVDKLLKKHFGLSVPLSAETYAGQWVPGCVLYNVEIEPDVWEARLEVFFDANVENSVESFRYRLGQHASGTEHYKLTKTLGEMFVDLWRSRWGDSMAKKVQRQPQEKLDVKLAPVKRPQAKETAKIEIERKTQELRGRLRRRERRRHQVRGGSSSTSEESNRELEDESSPFGWHQPRRSSINQAGTSEDDLKMRYKSLELEIKNRNSTSPVELIIEFPTQDSQDLDHDADEVLGPPQLQPPHRRPQLIIRRLDSNDPAETPPKLWHIMSYSRRSTEGSVPDNSGVHIADLVDEAGFVGLGNWVPQNYMRTDELDQSKGFISVIEANPSMLDLHSHSQTSVSRDERDRYWHKFAVLVGGIYSPFRELPYSLATGFNIIIPKS